MSEEKMRQHRAPYLLFLGDVADDIYGKTAHGLHHWRPDLIIGKNRLTGCGIELAVPDVTVAEAVENGVGSLIIGVSPIGGKLPEKWYPVILEAIDAGLDIVSGLHSRLVDIVAFADAAAISGARLFDVRVPPHSIPIGTGVKRAGKRVLMVGTDCAVGKKYSALALLTALSDLGIRATFRATGQTGIMIAGAGVAIDAVIADFISGAAEQISPENDPEHWDVIEGQGSLFNPAYAGVTLGLMHGSQPDALVMCHEATLTQITGLTGYTVPPFGECMDTYLKMAKLTNPDVRFAGFSINTSKLPGGESRTYLDELAKQFRLPAIDPVIGGSGAIARYLRDDF